MTTLSRPSVFMLEFSGQLTTPDRFSYHTGLFTLQMGCQIHVAVCATCSLPLKLWCGTSSRNLKFLKFHIAGISYLIKLIQFDSKWPVGSILTLTILDLELS